MKLPEEFTFTEMARTYPKGTKEIKLNKKQHRRYYDLIMSPDEMMPFFLPTTQSGREISIPLMGKKRPYKENDKYYFRGIPVTA